MFTNSFIKCIIRNLLFLLSMQCTQRHKQMCSIESLLIDILPVLHSCSLLWRDRYNTNECTQWNNIYYYCQGFYKLQSHRIGRCWTYINPVGFPARSRIQLNHGQLCPNAIRLRLPREMRTSRAIMFYSLLGIVNWLNLFTRWAGLSSLLSGSIWW